jgi:hypothetical protein
MQLPEELLWTILGCLDVQSLRTARLVCRQFRKSATTHFKALQVDCTNLQDAFMSDLTENFPLPRVAVTIKDVACLSWLPNSRVGPVVTQVVLVRPTNDWDLYHMLLL